MSDRILRGVSPTPSHPPPPPTPPPPPPPPTSPPPPPPPLTLPGTDNDSVGLPLFRWVWPRCHGKIHSRCVGQHITKVLPLRWSVEEEEEEGEEEEGEGSKRLG